MNTEIPGHLGNRFPGLQHNAHRPGPKLRIVSSSYLRHGSSSKSMSPRYGGKVKTNNDVRILRQHSLHIIGLLSSIKLSIRLSNHLNTQLRESIPSTLTHRIGKSTRRMPQQSRRVPPRPHPRNLITTQNNLTRRSSLLTTRPLSNRRHRHRLAECCHDFCGWVGG